MWTNVAHQYVLSRQREHRNTYKKTARHEKELRTAFIVEIRDVIKFLRQVDELLPLVRGGRDCWVCVCKYMEGTSQYLQSLNPY